ncbi:hypothetical protein GCM10018966_005370 [Streptomyces yanii]
MRQARCLVSGIGKSEGPDSGQDGDADDGQGDATGHDEFSVTRSAEGTRRSRPRRCTETRPTQPPGPAYAPDLNPTVAMFAIKDEATGENARTVTF